MITPLLACLRCVVIVVAIAPIAAGQEVDYVRDVKPLLARHCVACHGSKVQKAGLRLDTAEAIQRGGAGGAAIVAGDSAASLLLRAVTGTAGATPMPYKRDPLSAQEIATLQAWIAQGAAAPRGESASQPDASGHWSLQPIVSPALPAVKEGAWVRNAIDRFILARLQERGLAPSPEADRGTLIRRLSLDLLGLPPSVEEVDAFLLDNRPDAYERLVDRLLESPHYGERWARHWLDVARYADSNGFNIDAPRSIWKYRDWVIAAFNNDMPFDRFTIEQIAGDMLPRATIDQIVATGFHRNTLLNQEGGIDLEQYRVEYVVDRVSTTGVVFLGLTLGCARCHEHKFDPISQEEFYQFFAFFNNSDEPTIEVATPELLARRDAIRAQYQVLEKELNSYSDSLAARLPEWEKQLRQRRGGLGPDIQVILNTAQEKRDEKHKSKLLQAFLSDDAGYQQRKGTIDELRRQEPKFATSMVMRERAEPREAYLHIKGDFTRRGATVTPAVPASLHPLRSSSATRLDLARWLVDPANPLTARVTVNRFWQRFFGLGLVETENDFGTQGTPPSHPELLDWLAAEFMSPRAALPSRPGRGAWSIKGIHRLIVTSATYRQSSHARAGAAAIDPRNRLLARQSRFRLEAEVIRDSALAASGLLSRKVGGPGVFPPQPPGSMTLGQMQREWTTSTGEDRYRRGMYTYFWRATPYPGLTVFDAPDTTQACTRRNRSNTPLQALTLLNDQSFFELSQGMARRVLGAGLRDNAERVAYAFRQCLARRPAMTEARSLAEFVAAQADEFRSAQKEAAAVAPGAVPGGMDRAELAAWTVACRVLMNLDEFITRE